MTHIWLGRGQSSSQSDGCPPLLRMSASYADRLNLQFLLKTYRPFQPPQTTALKCKKGPIYE